MVEKVFNKNEKSCRPTTLKQIKKVKLKNEDQYLLDQHEITNVTVIGIIRSITKQDTHISFTIEDGTGAIDVKYWNSEDTDQATLDINNIQQACDVYIRAIGRLRAFNQHITLIAAFIRPINDPNEISFHYLNVIHTHLSTRTTLDTYANKTPMKDNTKNVVKRVIQLHGQNNNGITIQSIVSHLKNTIDETKIMEAIENLSIEGQVYNITEDSIKLIDI